MTEKNLAPITLVKESEKTTAWIEQYLRYISSLSSLNEYYRNDITCWSYYQNLINKDNTDYLTKIGGSELPATVRRIPKQRPFVDRLVSQQERRPFVFSCVLSDKKSIEDKYLDQANDYIEAIKSNAQYIHFETSFKIQQIEEKIAQMQSMVQQEPKTADEAQQIMQLKQQLPVVINNFQYAITMLNEQGALTQEQISKLKYYHRYEKKDWKEIAAQKMLLMLRQELNVNSESTEAFKIGRVVGRQYFYVDYEEGNRLPTFKSLDPITVTYPKISSVKWVQDGPWVKITEYMSYNDIVTTYGDKIVEKYGQDKLEKLSNVSSENTHSMIRGNNGEAYFNEESMLYSGTDDNNYGIKVERIWIKVPRNIKVKYTPNPFEEGIYFRHFIQNKEVIDKRDWKYDNGFYINKKNDKDVRQEGDVEVVNSLKGEKYRNKYTNDRWYGVIINNEIIVCEGKQSFVLRDIDFHGKILLPVFGKTYSSISDQPYSLIMATKDLQDLYDIVHYHQELMLALSGTKTVLFDTAFKPASMTDEQWEADKKKGTLNIESIGPDGKRQQSVFNQWTMFDLSVSSSIGTLEQIKTSIEETMGDIMGVPRQMKGQMVATDQVGTYNASLKQAGLITEIMFAEHDLIESKALTHALNLALTFCYKDGETFGINNNDLSGEIINIPPNVFNKIRFSVLVANNTDEGQGMEDMKQLIIGNWKSGQMQFSDVVDLWGIKTLAELKDKSKYMAEKAQEIRTMIANNSSQAEVEKEKLKIQLNNELLAPWKEQELRLKEMELQIKQSLGQMNSQVLSQKNQVMQKQIENDTVIKSAKIQAQKEVDDSSIAMNDKHLNNNEKIKMLEIQVNSLLKDAKIKSDNLLSNRKQNIDMGNMVINSQKQTAIRSNKLE